MSVELIDSSAWPTLKKDGLSYAIASAGTWGGHPGLEQQRLLLWTAWLICRHHREMWQGGRGTVDRMTVCVEYLNSSVADHPMKGNRGDDLCKVEGLIRQVDPPRLKLLFDI